MTVAAILVTLLSGLYGVVTRRPITPVCQVSVPCTGPFGHATLVFSRPGSARRVTADAKGAYRIALPPGRWALRVQNAPFGWTPRTVLVPSARYAKLNVSVDTGIR